MPRAQKIQLGIVISMIGIILALLGNLVSYVRAEQNNRNNIFQAQKDITDMKPKVEKVLVIESEVKGMSKDIDEIKGDVKLLLQRKQ